jgi:hypothetical protein
VAAVLRRHRHGCALAVFVAFAVALFPAAMVGARAVSANDIVTFFSPFADERPAGLLRPSNPLLGDPVYVFHPGLSFARDQIRSGALPLWDPFQVAGRPALASQQVAPLFPLTFVAYVLPLWLAVGYLLALKILLAAVGTYLFARLLGLRWAAGVLAALTYAGSPYFVVWLQHPHTNAYAMLPWLFLAGHLVANRPNIRNAGLLALAVGLAWLGGHPQSALLVTVPAAGYLAFAALRAGRNGDSWRYLARVFAFASGALALGLGLAAVMLLPLAEALGHTSETSRGTPPMPLKGLVALFMPEWWGRPDDVILGTGGPVNFPERTAYAGVAPVLLGTMAFVLRRDGRVWFFVGLGLLAGIVAFDVGPLSEAARQTPILSRVSLDRIVIVIVFAIAMLGALGLDAVMRSPARTRPWALGLSLTLGAVPLILILADGTRIIDMGDVVAQLPGMRHDEMDLGDVRWAQAFRWTLLTALVGTALWFALGRRRGRTIAIGIVLAVTFADLLAVDAGYHPQTDPRVAKLPSPDVIDFLREDAGTGRIGALENELGPNLAARFRLRDLRGHDHPPLERPTRLFGAAGGTGSARLLVPAQERTRAFQLFAVSRVLSATALPGMSLAPGSPTTSTGGRVYENPSALPRAWFATGWRTAPNDLAATAATLASSKRELLRRPVVEGILPRRALPKAHGSSVAIREESTTRVLLDVNTRVPGLVVLHDTWYPGWKARIDGEDADIVVANAAFRGVRVPRPGHHRIEFVYRPASVYVGIALSGLSLLLIAAAVFWRRQTSLRLADRKSAT